MTKEIAKTENAVAVQSPVEFMTLALSKNMEVDKLEKMLELQERYEKNEAKKVYIKAMAEFKSQPLMITKDKRNAQYSSEYTTLGNLVNTTLPLMSKAGLSHKWDIEQTQEIIKVTCIVTHAMGHSDYTTMSAPPDKSGAKNDIQKIKSTITYLKSVTFESAMGLASSDSNFDDDGNSNNLEFITHEQVKTITDMITSKGINLDEVLQFCECETIDTIPGNKYKPLISRLKMPVVKNS